MGGGNSGFGALNLAVLKGAKRIVLLGYDFRFPAHHWFPAYPWGTTQDKSAMYRHWANQFAYSVPVLDRLGVKIWNASPKSLVEAFPKIALDALPLAETAGMALSPTPAPTIA